MSCLAPRVMCLVALFTAGTTLVGSARVMDFFDEEAKHSDDSLEDEKIPNAPPTSATEPPKHSSVSLEPITDVAAIQGEKIMRPSATIVTELAKHSDVSLHPISDVAAVEDETITRFAPTAAKEPSNAVTHQLGKSMLAVEPASDELNWNNMTALTATSSVGMNLLPSQAALSEAAATGLPILTAIVLFLYVLTVILAWMCGVNNKSPENSQTMAEKLEEDARLLDCAFQVCCAKEGMLAEAFLQKEERVNDPEMEPEPEISCHIT